MNKLHKVQMYVTASIELSAVDDKLCALCGWYRFMCVFVCWLAAIFSRPSPTFIPRGVEKKYIYLTLFEGLFGWPSLGLKHKKETKRKRQKTLRLEIDTVGSFEVGGVGFVVGGVVVAGRDW